MEKENQKMLENEEQLAEKRLKLDYLDLTEGDPANVALWDEILSNQVDMNSDMLREAVAKGVPQTRRGEAWHMLVTGASTTNTVTQTASEQFPNMTADYLLLKSQLTSHQHAILIDLGRTFPNHGYFSGALGPGQCGLFNLLKAYSILDPEVGYCQGLPFCVGMLLMHTEEEPSFQLLKHLMFSEGLRRQFNPDMSGLQVSMYQLTRLLAETHPKLYKQLDKLEGDPSLYATPWFLTLFAAHFPLGFLGRGSGNHQGGRVPHGGVWGADLCLHQLGRVDDCSESVATISGAQQVRGCCETGCQSEHHQAAPHLRGGVPSTAGGAEQQQKSG